MDAISSERRFSNDDVLAYETDPADFVYNITVGNVRLSHLMADGRRAVIGFLRAGDFLGLAYQDHFLYTAEAIGEVVACHIDRRKMEALMDEIPEMKHRLMTMMTKEVAASKRQMVLLGRKSPTEKIATFLIDMHSEQCDGELFIDLPMSRQDIADHLGLTIETVSRTLSALDRDDVIKRPSPSRIDVMSMDKLKELSGD